MRGKGFVPDGAGGWSKPKATGAARETQSAEPERVVFNAPVGEIQREALYTGRCLVRVESFRRRLIDPDNLVPKYFVDSLRYLGALRDDRAEDIEIRVSQTKVSREEDEETVITLTEIG